MKQLSFFALVAIMLFAAPTMQAAEGDAMGQNAATKQQPQMLRGSVVDEEGHYISYVTVVVSGSSCSACDKGSIHSR